MTSTTSYTKRSLLVAVTAISSAIIGCSNSIEPTYPKLGSVEVYVATSGAPAYLDSDGYTLSVDGNTGQPVPSTSAAAISVDVLAGRHTLKLDGLADNCEVNSPNPTTVDVALNQTVNVSFAIQCSKPVINVTASLITYVGGAADSAEIYVMPAEGGAGYRLTIDQAWDGDPAWSPDGSKIVFASDRDGDREIYVMNADGTDQTRLTKSAGVDHLPTWSPDGTRIAFTSERNRSEDGIYVMNADGTNVQRLMATATNPDWSPDGKHIAFNTGDGIWIMDADGSNPTRLTSNPREDYAPTWSPDGTRIAFVRTWYYTSDLFVVNADGSGASALSNIYGDFQHPSWSPDGKSVVYGADVFGQVACFTSDGETCDRRLRVIGLDGSFRELSARNPAYSPAWRR